ncbi:MAG: hypothetical protein BJ554DRAFT_5751, partial [Olpidium bornovanus]
IRSRRFPSHSHVAKTGDIKHFGLIEETAVAKGIRRIVAVTGEEAQEAARVADEFLSRLEYLSSLEFSLELENALKEVGKELDALQISAGRKAEFRERYAEVKKKFDDRDKARKAAEVKEAVDEIKRLLEEREKEEVVVVELKVGAGNAKALAAAVQHGKALGSKAMYLFSIDKNKGVVTHSCVVPKDLIGKGLKATEWSGAVVEILGGKRGGKDDAAQGSGTNIEAVDEAVRLAEEFAKMKIGK